MEESKIEAGISLEDFQIQYKIGEGAYGCVFLVSIHSKQYALKEMSKHKLKKHSAEHFPLIERQILKNVQHPGIVHSHFFFQTHSKFYIALQLCKGGKIEDLVSRKKMNEEARRFYFGQLVNVIQYLHSIGIVHRDLKPCNLMLNSKNNLTVIDFGTACIQNSRLIPEAFKEKIRILKRKAQFPEQLEAKGEQYYTGAIQMRRRRSSFVGTSYYVSPQLLEKDQCNYPADIWALGCILYYFYYGCSPFTQTCQYKIYQKITKGEVQFPENSQLNEEAKDLILRLLVKCPQQRLGSGQRQQLSFSALKKHPYLVKLDIDGIYSRQSPVTETITSEMEVKLRQIVQKIHLEDYQNQSELLFRQILIKNGPEEDYICRLDINKDRSVNIYEIIGSTISDIPLSFRLIQDAKGNFAHLLNENKFCLRVEGAEYLFFTSSEISSPLCQFINGCFRKDVQKSEVDL